MRCACIDIGSNTTRVLVADVDGGELTAIHEAKAFNHLGRELRATGRASPERIADLADCVRAYHRAAVALEATAIRAVATAAVRAAANRDALLAAVRERGGVEVEVLDGEEEARLAFLGATRTLAGLPDGPVAVVDVGGGSSEIAIGTVDAGVTWSVSCPVGSGVLAEEHLRSDPPTPAELGAVRARAAAAFADLGCPPVLHAVAVGGSATSLKRLVGHAPEPGDMDRAVEVVAGAPAADVARRSGLEPERVRLLGAGILLLDAVADRLGCGLQIGCGGLREGVCLRLASPDGD